MANFDVIFGATESFTVSVTPSETLVRAANTGRKYALIRNMDAGETVYLNFGSAGTYGQGIPLKAGEAFELNRTNLTDASIHATPNTGKTVVIAGVDGV